MKAIVLTYDKYHPFTDHMIRSYDEVWPDHPFKFRVPYQQFPEQLNKIHGSKIELIQTNSSIKSTVLSLIEDLDDEEWIYWCIDDKYPVVLDPVKMDELYNKVCYKRDSDMSGLMFSFRRNIRRRENSHSKLYNGNILPEYDLIRRKNYRMIWIHQYLKVKVIKYLFERFPDDIKSAKEMDSLIEDVKLPNEHSLFALNKSIVEYGESTHRGLITKNCSDSFKKFGMNIPDNFSITEKEIFMGSDKYEEPLLLWKFKNLIRFIDFRNG